MTTREDVELLRQFARRHWSPTGGVVGGMIADLINSRQAAGRATVAELLHAIVRLYSSNPNTAAHKVLFAKDDIESLRNALEDVPMTVAQRKRVSDRLGKLEMAVACEVEQHDDVTMKRGPLEDLRRAVSATSWEEAVLVALRHARAEFPAEQAIESITEEIGIHNYHDAARAVLATWRATVQIREDQGLSTKPSAVAASAVNVAVAVARDFAAIGKLRGIFNTSPTAEGNSMLVRCAQEAHHSSAAGGHLLGIMAKWRAWNAGDPETVSQRRVLDILKAIRMPVNSGLFQAALTETIDVLEYMLDEIPF